MSRQRLILIPILLIIFSAQVVFGASVAITPAGNGNFIIQGNGMDGVAGVDLTIAYDNKTLASPTVSEGSLISGATMIANTDAPGAIRVVVIRLKAFTGSGPIVSVSFASHTGNGNFTITSTTMIDLKGNTLAVAGGGKANATDYQTNSPGSSFGGLVQTDSTSGGGTTLQQSPKSSIGSTSLGTVVLPTEAQTKSEPKQPEAVVEPAQIPEPAAPKEEVEPPTEEKQATKQQKPAEITSTSYKEVLETFGSYAGEKTPAALVAIMRADVASAIHQEPPVALSDGKTTVRIKVKLAKASEKSPNFVLNSAKLVSLKKGASTSEWVVEALPQTNVLQAGLTILTDDGIIEFPLTVAPAVSGVTANETDFATFLKDSGAKPPRHDFNGDGKHDYRDDYIYTANYLIIKGAADKGVK
ncbi:MAG: hypothetical protein GJV46_05400 [Geobacter sp.]|nr:hypothetical protein [Geobacter sp.]